MFEPKASLSGAGSSAPIFSATISPLEIVALDRRVVNESMAAHRQANWEMMMADQLRDARADARYWRLMFIGIAAPVGIVLVAYGWAWMRMVGWLQ